MPPSPYASHDGQGSREVVWTGEVNLPALDLKAQIAARQLDEEVGRMRVEPGPRPWGSTRWIRPTHPVPALEEVVSNLPFDAEAVLQTLTEADALLVGSSGLLSRQRKS